MAASKPKSGCWYFYIAGSNSLANGNSLIFVRQFGPPASFIIFFLFFNGILPKVEIRLGFYWSKFIGKFDIFIIIFYPRKLE